MSNVRMSKITIGVPVYGGIQPKTMQCLMELVNESKHDIHIVIAEDGYTIAENRSYITVKALNNRSDYLLMIDADMTFKPTILDDLMSNDKDICGVAYHPRCDTGKIIKYMDEVTSVAIEESDDPKYKDTFECHATGTGIILIKCDVFRKIPQPWFMFEYYDNGMCKLGEDWYFCEKAKKYNIKTYTDPKPSVGHLGEQIII